MEKRREKWYFLDGSGAMKTGWQKISYPGVYKNDPYWNYFDSSGAFVTDSDTEGCSHRKNTFKDNKYLYGADKTYVIYKRTLETPESTIISGVNLWNNAPNFKGKLTYKGDGFKGGIVFQSASYLGDGTVAEHQAYYGDKHIFLANGGKWTHSVILLSTKYSVGADVIAHKVGHSYGLSHRVTIRDSIMCLSYEGRTAKKTSWKDIDAVNHLY